MNESGERIAFLIAVLVLAAMWLPRSADEPASAWTGKNRVDLAALSRQCGAPDELGSAFAVWRRCRPWKRLVLRNGGAWDRFEATVPYSLTPAEAAMAPALPGHILADSDAAELTSTADDPRLNLLALNLAHETILGVRSIASAREEFHRSAMRLAQGESAPLSERLIFRPPPAVRPWRLPAPVSPFPRERPGARAA